jgi:hypothetical protein
VYTPPGVGGASHCSYPAEMAGGGPPTPPYPCTLPTSLSPYPPSDNPPGPPHVFPAPAAPPPPPGHNPLQEGEPSTAKTLPPRALPSSHRAAALPSAAPLWRPGAGSPEARWAYLESQRCPSSMGRDPYSGVALSLQASPLARLLPVHTKQSLPLEAQPLTTLVCSPKPTRTPSVCSASLPNARAVLALHCPHHMAGTAFSGAPAPYTYPLTQCCRWRHDL